MSTQSSDEQKLDESAPERVPDDPATVTERLDALSLAIKSFAEAYQIIVNDLAHIEAILFNIESAFGEVLEGNDVSEYIARIRQRLAHLQVFQPDGAAPAGQAAVAAGGDHGPV